MIVKRDGQRKREKERERFYVTDYSNKITKTKSILFNPKLVAYKRNEVIYNAVCVIHYILHADSWSLQSYDCLLKSLQYYNLP